MDYANSFFRPGDLYWSPADWAWVGGLLVGLFGPLAYGIPVLASTARFDPNEPHTPPRREPLGRPYPGHEVAIVDDAGRVVPPCSPSPVLLRAIRPANASRG